MAVKGSELKRIFAVIPAAGESRRMGRAKLLLPLEGRSVIARLLDALGGDPIEARVVVVRPGDDALCKEAEGAGATVVVPQSPPPDMRASVKHAIDFIACNFGPTDADSWLLVPADHPVLERAIVRSIVDTCQRSDAKIVVPTFQGRSGHPTLFRWELAREVENVPPDRGLDWLLEKHAGDVQRIELANEAILCDLDTPEQYERLKERFREG
ncbi:MAG: NTP transferase domain-containing protein [Planctomycetaceae bacterium]